MKRFLAVLTALVLLISGMPLYFASAEPTGVEVKADESWTEATYDPETQYLTNVTDGYYFTVEFDTGDHTFKLSGVSGYLVEAPRVVIPSQITYNGIVYDIETVSSYTLSGKKNTNNPNVKEIIISEGVTTIGNSSFRSLKGVTSVKLPSTIKKIDSLAFAGDSSLSDISFPDGIETIGGQALQGTAITKIRIPSSVTSFGGSMFYGCSKLTEVNFEIELDSIASELFRGCSSLPAFEIPETVTSLGKLSFSQAGISEIVIPAAVTSLPSQVFANCKKLKNVTINGEVSVIESKAFSNCSVLETVTFMGKTAPATMDSTAFSGVSGSKLTVNYPADGVGYDDPEWQALFPDGTTFVRAQGEPMANDLVIEGKNVVGNVLTASYTYFDPMDRPESGSTTVWESCADEDFTSSDVTLLKTEDCSQDSPSTYEIQETDDGKFIRATVVPRNADQKLNVGEPSYAMLSEKIRLPQTMPIVTLTAPSDGYTVNCKSEVNLSANAVCDNTTITKVEFYANDICVATAETEPFDAVWAPQEMGTYEIYAKAYNALGEDADSESVNLTVLSEDAEIDAYITITFTSPVADSYTLTGTEVSVTGSAVESSGSPITSIDFYDNGKLFQSVNTGTFDFKYEFETGVHNITAKAKSADGKTGYSEPFDITISGMSFTNIFGDNMVLQRNKPVKLTGFGVDGTTVTAEICGITSSAVAKDGKWQIIMPALPTNQGTTLTFTASDGTSKTFNNVAIGEVLICSGQSNMTAGIGGSHPYASNNPYDGIRLFRTGVAENTIPQDNVAKGEWNVSTTSLIKSFSAVGYLTGYHYYLSQNGEVPVGIIQAAVSGTDVNLWVPNGAYTNDPDLKRKAKTKTHFNAMIAPWTNYTIGQIVWYQGESNSLLKDIYEKQLTAYIDSNREAFGDESIRFIIIQLPVYDTVTGYNSHTRTFWLVREGQWNVSEHLDNVETVVTMDTGSLNTVHPSGKDIVGKRAGLIMQHFASPEDDIIWKSPNYAGVEIADGKAVISFNDVGEGLTTTDGLAPRGFKIGGSDGVFVDADAQLVGNTVEIDVSSIEGPVYIRYAWEDVPARTEESPGWSLNLVNSAGLPAAPFKTDSFKEHFSKYDSETGTYSDPYNYTPYIRYIKAGDIEDGKSIIEINARDYDDGIEQIELFVDNNSVGYAVQSEDNEDIWTFEWTGATAGEHTFYAIATDEYGLTSIKEDPLFGSTTVSPEEFVYTLSSADTSIELDFDENGNAVSITAFEGVLVVAAYSADNTLLRVAISEEKSATIEAEYLTDAKVVKAFVVEDLDNIRPVSNCVYISK